MKQIIITVEGGVIQDIQHIPRGTQVKVLDFDTDGAEEDDLTIVNAKGEKAYVSYWGK